MPWLLFSVNITQAFKPLVQSESGGDNTFFAAQIKTLDFVDLAGYVQQKRYVVRRETLDDSGWSLSEDKAQALLDKLKAAGVPLGEYVNGQIYYGIKTGLNEAFVIDAATRAKLIKEDPNSATLIKPFLMGRDVKRYETPTAERYLILIPNGWTREQIQEKSRTDRTMGLSPLSKEPMPLSEDSAWAWLKSQYPAVAGQLEPFRERAIKRWDKGEFWWELRPCDYYDKFEQPKILFPDVSSQGNFVFDRSTGWYCANTTYFLATDDEFLLGVLNSKLANFIYKRLFSNYRGGYLRFFQQYLVEIPIPRTMGLSPLSDNASPLSGESGEKAQHERMVALVEQMLDLKRQHAEAESALDDRRHELAERMARVDREIDQLVYELYGLTADEIRIVEG